jgi:hypothetical protein
LCPKWTPASSNALISTDTAIMFVLLVPHPQP